MATAEEQRLPPLLDSNQAGISGTNIRSEAQKLTGKIIPNEIGADAEADPILVAPPLGPTMIQPFMEAIQSEGEWSLLYFGGQFSHAVLKTPKLGDFRSQPDYQSHVRRVAPPLEALSLAQDVLDYLSQHVLLYARIDMVRNAKGQFCLMEVELIEPDLYLSFDDHAAQNLAKAFSERLGL